MTASISQTAPSGSVFVDGSLPVDNQVIITATQNDFLESGFTSGIITGTSGSSFKSVIVDDRRLPGAYREKTDWRLWSGPVNPAEWHTIDLKKTYAVSSAGAKYLSLDDMTVGDDYYGYMYIQGAWVDDWHTQAAYIINRGYDVAGKPYEKSIKASVMNDDILNMAITSQYTNLTQLFFGAGQTRMTETYDASRNISNAMGSRSERCKHEFTFGANGPLSVRATGNNFAGQSGGVWVTWDANGRMTLPPTPVNLVSDIPFLQQFERSFDKNVYQQSVGWPLIALPPAGPAPMAPPPAP